MSGSHCRVSSCHHLPKTRDILCCNIPTLMERTNIRISNKWSLYFIQSYPESFFIALCFIFDFWKKYFFRRSSCVNWQRRYFKKTSAFLNIIRFRMLTEKLLFDCSFVVTSKFKLYRKCIAIEDFIHESEKNELGFYRFTSIIWKTAILVKTKCSAAECFNQIMQVTLKIICVTVLMKDLMPYLFRFILCICCLPLKSI